MCTLSQIFAFQSIYKAIYRLVSLCFQNKQHYLWWNCRDSCNNQRLWNRETSHRTRDDVVQWWILDFVKWRGYRDRGRLAAQFTGSDRGGCEFRSWFHAVARVPRQILVTEGGEGGRSRRKADIIVQTTATIAEGHGYASDASLPPRREGWPRDRDSRGISWWVDWILQFSLCFFFSPDRYCSRKR